jgi:hypothetical protein
MPVSMTASPRVMNEVLKDRSITHIFMTESRYLNYFNTLVKSMSLRSFVHLRNQYVKSLEVVAFLCDDMQLPPFGQSEIKSMNNLILPSLISAGVCDENFLKHQYRMHHTIAKFLDLNVYFSRLITPIERIFSSANLDGRSPIAWINIVSRQSGFSTMNHGEADAIRDVIIARNLKPTDYAGLLIL